MAKSNWKGTSGWGAINDPTGTLNGRVLVASAGLTSTNEDYLTTIVGTSTSFSADHYSVYMDYAVPNFNEIHPMAAASLGLIARSSNFQGSPESAYDCYRGELNVEEKKVKIIRKNNNSETILMSSDMPNTAISRGKRHTMEFRCYGTNAPTLQLLIDNQLVANIGDTSSSKLNSGFPGIHMRNGTAYLDSFTIKQYTEDGQAPALWTPMQVTGTTLSAWYIGSEGVSSTGTTITSWNDQSINNNHLTASSEPQLNQSDINNYDTISFDGIDDGFSATHSTSLNLNKDGLSFFIIVNSSDFTNNRGFIGKDTSYASGISSNGRYAFTGTDIAYSSAGTTNSNQLISIVTDKSDTTGEGGIWINGSLTAGITFGTSSNNTDPLTIGASLAGFFEGKIAEIVLINGESDTEQRQLVEGYLAQKYAMWSNLPSDHPYRSYAPTIQ